MPIDGETIQSLAIIGGFGAVAGLIAGFVASADNLLGTVLVGILGGVSLSAILRIANVPGIYSIGEFSVVWGILGGLVLGWAVGRAR